MLETGCLSEILVPFLALSCSCTVVTGFVLICFSLKFFWENAVVPVWFGSYRVGQCCSSHHSAVHGAQSIKGAVLLKGFVAGGTEALSAVLRKASLVLGFFFEGKKTRLCKRQQLFLHSSKKKMTVVLCYSCVLCLGVSFVHVYVYRMSFFS